MRKVVLLALLLVVAGCGDKTDYVRIADTEGISVDVGNLSYQVQISRYLNPGNVDDFQYLQGVVEPAPTGSEIWFGVFMRVKNYSDETRTPTTQFVINDTEGNKFFPISLPKTNVFAYRPIPLHGHQVLPTPNSASATGPIQGSLILFKLK